MAIMGHILKHKRKGLQTTLLKI